MFAFDYKWSSRAVVCKHLDVPDSIDFSRPLLNDGAQNSIGPKLCMVLPMVSVIGGFRCPRLYLPEYVAEEVEAAQIFRMLTAGPFVFGAKGVASQVSSA